MRILAALCCVSVVASCGPPISLDSFVLSTPVTEDYILDKERCKAEVLRKRPVDTQYDAAGGAIGGGITGVLIGDSFEAAAAGAVIGLISAASDSNRSQMKQQRALIAQCLRDNGHKVAG